MRSLSVRQMPAGAHAVVLRGASGSLAALGAPGVTWHHTPGHAPSHVVYAHAASQSLLAGDIADLLLDPPGGVSALPDGRPIIPGQLAAFTMTAMHRASGAQAAASLCRVAYDAAIPYDTARPYHDATKRGVSRAQLQLLAEAAAHCGGKAPSYAATLAMTPPME